MKASLLSIAITAAVMALIGWWAWPDTVACNAYGACWETDGSDIVATIVPLVFVGGIVLALVFSLVSWLSDLRDEVRHDRANGRTRAARRARAKAAPDA